MALVLRRLTESDEKAFFDGMSEWPEHDRAWYTFAWKPGMSYQEMLMIVDKESRGIDILPERVPATMLYGFVGDQIIGRLHIRHTLNEQLRHRGGNIGYAVAPRFRGRGYASEMLTQALPFCAFLGMKDILITCSDDNKASWKIIEKFAAQLENKVWDDQDQEMIRRYWLKIG